MSEVGEKVLELRGSGMSSVEIAHRLGVAQSTVHYYLRKPANSFARAEGESPAFPRHDAARSVGTGLERSVGTGLERSFPTGPVRSVPTRELVGRLLAKGIARAEVARRLGIAKSTVSYHAGRLGEPIDGRSARRYDWRVVQRYYDAGHTVRQCAQAFGFSVASWHEAIKRGVVEARPGRRPLEEIFAPNTRRSRGHLKRRLLCAGLKENRCETCGLTEWMGQPLSVALHHINGDRLDNRLENLQLLCPNCHSQTDTFAGRNGRKTPL